MTRDVAAAVALHFHQTGFACPAKIANAIYNALKERGDSANLLSDGPVEGSVLVRHPDYDRVEFTDDCLGFRITVK